MGSIWRACVNQWETSWGAVCVWGPVFAGRLGFYGFIWPMLPQERKSMSKAMTHGTTILHHRPELHPRQDPCGPQANSRPGASGSGAMREQWAHILMPGAHVSFCTRTLTAASSVGKFLENHFIRSKVKCFKAPTRDTQSKLARNP